MALLRNSSQSPVSTCTASARLDRAIGHELCTTVPHCRVSAQPPWSTCRAYKAASTTSNPPSSVRLALLAPRLPSEPTSHDAAPAELLSEQQLSALLAPSLRYLLVLATHRYPRYLLRALNRFDELYALLALVLERHHLRTYGGSFTEHFYALKRERVFALGPELPRAQRGSPAEVCHALALTHTDVWRNLLVLVGVPYLRRKLDESHDVLVPRSTALVGDGVSGAGVRRDALPEDATLRQRAARLYVAFLRHVYPSVNAAFHLSQLAFQLGYLFDATRHHSPLLWLVGTRMRRLGEADRRAFEAAAAAASASGGAARAGRGVTATASRLTARALGGTRLLLPAAVFALKFLEWWHASDFARQLSRKAAEGVALPPPVLTKAVASASAAAAAAAASRSEKKDGGVGGGGAIARVRTRAQAHAFPTSATSGLPIFTVPAPAPAPSVSAQPTKGTCPICEQGITTATATAAGYVFCYACVHRWVAAGETGRQEAFMRGEGSEGDEERAVAVEQEGEDVAGEVAGGRGGGEKGREGRWEDGRGRCPVSGVRLLGGTEGLRRVVA